METFGAGNAPQRADFMDALKEACDCGVVIVAISQCSKGSVSAHYETGIGLLKVGVVSGGDMTPEVRHICLAYDNTSCTHLHNTVRTYETRLSSEQAGIVSRSSPNTHWNSPPWRTDRTRE